MYLVLVMGLLLFVALAYYFRFSPGIQSLAFFGASIFYSLWGVIHHYIEDNLTNAIAAEYLLFSFIVFLLAVMSTGAFTF